MHPNNFNHADLDAVDKEDLQYFKAYFANPKNLENTVGKTVLLGQAFIKCKIKVVKFFMDNGVALPPHDIRLRFIVEKENDISILHYLESKNVNLTGNVLLLTASSNNNEVYTNFFADKIKVMDDKNTILALVNVFRKYDYKLSEVDNILDILLPKITLGKMDELINSNCFSIGTKEKNEAFIKKKYLDFSLAKPQSSTSSVNKL